MLPVGSFASVATLLALTGIYGVVSYSVSRRVPELGLRIALGARGGEIARFVLRQALGLTFAGIAAGVAGALLCGRALTSVLSGKYAQLT